ncbi:hypothetical protein Tco_0682677 [Tanacetum coccineum]|uniref:Uncharacterized protein n=1 Tax=Tanacetum coccineum TaxID=301880 RepID=A0ABQ4XTJ5_9ASTR
MSHSRVSTADGCDRLVFRAKVIENAGFYRNSRVPAPFLEDPYEAIRHACLVETDTESEPFEDPIDTETPKSPHAVASPTPLPDSTPPACHTEESEDSDTSGARSTSLDFTAPLSPDHPLTRTSPTLTPTRASFHRRTARMTVHAQPVMSPSHSARVAKAMALTDSALRKRYRSSYETSLSSSPALPVRKRYRGTSELILDTNSKEDEIGEEDTDEDEGHGLDDEGHGLDDEGRSVESDGLGLKGEEEVVPEGQSSRSVPKPERPERVLILRQPTLTTWIDPEDGSLPVSPTPSVVPSPISSPMISLTVPSPIALPVSTLTATIPDHTQRLDVMPPTLFVGIDKDVRELYTRSGVVVDEIFSQRYKFRSLELEQERSVVTFGALWRPVLALEAWAVALQRELQEMRGRVTTLEQEKDLIMELLVKDSKRRAFWSLNEDILKITILKTNTPYPSRKIRRIHACTYQRPQRIKAQYAVSRETQYVVFKIWNQYNILEDIKHGPYSKKSPIHRIQSLDTLYRTDF